MTAETHGNFERNYSLWKDRLLDLSATNRLLNFRITKVSTIELTAPAGGELVEAILIEEKSLAFPHYRGKKTLPDGTEEHLVTPGDIETSKAAPDLERSLSRLTSLAKTYREERGVNTLYLAVGILNWRPAESAEFMKAPLVLIPVALGHEDRLHPYKLQPFDEDAEINPSLTYLLRRDFAFELPALPEEIQHETLDHILNKIRAAVEPRGWTVESRVWLAQFQFKKLAMYKDLEQHAEVAHLNERLMAITGAGDMREPVDIGDEDSFDDVPPEEVFTAFDADATQLAALLRARKGQDLIIQGPPGTGKSQTIANLIAQFLFEGKKVLFVSEKMAALDVVYDRLRKAGLADYCLELHSEKASKRDVLARISRASKAPTPRRSDTSRSFAELVQLRGRLNAYVRALHQPLFAGHTAFQLHGDIATLADVPDVLVSIEGDPRALGADAEMALIGLLGRVARYPEIFRSEQDHPWSGCLIEQWSYQVQADIEADLEKVPIRLEPLRTACERIAKLIVHSNPPDITNTSELLQDASLVAESPLPPPAWLDVAPINELRAEIQRQREIQAKYRLIKTRLSESYEQGFFKVDPLEAIRKLSPPFLHYLGGVEYRDQTSHAFCGLDSPEARSLSSHDPTNRVNKHPTICKACGVSLDFSSRSSRAALHQTARKVSSLLSSERQLLTQIGEAGDQLQNAIGSSPDRSLRGDAGAVVTSQLLALVHAPAPSWLESGRTDLLLAAAGEARTRLRELKNHRSEALKAFSPTILQVRIDDLRSELRTKHGGWLRIFNPNYHRLARMIREHQTAGRKLNYFEMLAGLDRLSSAQETERWFEDRGVEFHSNFGQHYAKESTDWDDVIQRLSAVKHVLAARPSAFEDVTVREHLLLSNFDYRGAGERLQGLLESLHGTREDLRALLPVECEGYDDIDAASVWNETVSREIADFATTVDQIGSFARASENAVDDYLDDLHRLEHLNGLEEEAARDRASQEENFGDSYAGWDTPWDVASQVLNWCALFRQRFGDNAPSSFAAQEASTLSELREVLPSARVALSECKQVLERLQSRFDASALNPPLVSRPFSEVIAWSAMRQKRIGELSEWAEYRATLRDCNRAGTTPFVKAAQTQSVPPELLQKAFLKRVRTLQLDAAYSELPLLARFRSADHQNAIAEFRRNDSELQVAHRRNIAATVASRRPDLNGVAAGQVAFLRREFVKQRRHAPLRKLLAQAGNVILQLTPCLLMSPLSVATYLQKDSVLFDIVIFDEASQMPPEEAIAAILRARQLIVAGDAKQMPPSRFFEKAQNDGDEETDDEITQPLESILEDCEAAGLESRRLHWHYRSKHESLIAFSNAEFYDNDLVTFPSADDAAGNCGLRFVHVPDGVYDRGHSRTNLIEADRVAELVVQHFDSAQSYRSLGVIALSLAQAEAIEDALERLFLTRPDLERRAQSGSEPFFVKPLENVQGDERDEVIISVGYARDRNGVFALQLGPVSADGGERRLNVAFTRARYRCTVVASIRSHDIDATRVSRRGPVVLKRYIEFAESGRLSEETLKGTGETESPFEEAVVKALRAAGIETETQVGASRYRIDIAVKDPKAPGRYLLGIECDGAMYHSSRVARDRDRIRDSELRQRGWRLHRIWSTEWTRDRRGVLSRLLNLIRELESNTETQLQDVLVPPGVVQYPQAQAATEPHQEELLPDQAPVNSQAVAEYREAHISGTRSLLYEQSESLKRLIITVVDTEGPVHESVVVTRVSRACGVQRAGSIVADTVLRQIAAAVRSRLIRRFEGFLWPADEIEVVPRRPAHDQSARSIEHIAPEEIAAAVFVVVRTTRGIEPEALVRESGRILGYLRTGTNVDRAVTKVVQEMVTDRRLVGRGTFLTTPDT